MVWMILMAGIGGVGKSTISARLAKELRAQIVHIDDFKRDVVDPAKMGNEIDPIEVRRLYYNKALEYAFGEFKKGAGVLIVEEVFHLAALRDEMRLACESEKVTALWVEVTCHYDIVKQRLQSNARSGHLLSTDEALGLHMLFAANFERFSPGDDHVQFDNGTADVESEIQRVSNYLRIRLPDYGAAP